MRSLLVPLALVLLTALFLAAVEGFLLVVSPSPSLTRILRTQDSPNLNPSAICSAGKGWDSDDYLNNLGGNGDPEAAAQEYRKRQKQREEMLQRQRASMSPEALQKAQEFMQERQTQLYAEAGEDDDDEQDDFISMNIPTNSQGGSRFQQMMMQQQTLKDRMRMQQQQQGGGPGGFEQKFAPIPLEDDEEENKED